jgi:hypothetical protein
MATLLPFLRIVVVVDDYIPSLHPLWPLTNLDDVLQI